MSNDLTSGITSQIAEHFGIDISKLTPETEVASLGIDSLSMIEFMFQMEEKFNVHLADSRAPLVTIADIVAEVERAVAGQQAGQQGGQPVTAAA